jgi:molybdenum cofactor guanylyltransferase
MKSQFPIPVVIIAGGKGLRIGGDKALRVLAGQSLLARSLDKAKLYSAQVAVAVTGLYQLPLPDSVSLLIDEAPGSGPIAGLSSALAYAEAQKAEYVLVIPCDTPFLPSDLLQRLHAGIGDANAAIAYYNDRLHAACTLWRTDAVKLLPPYLAQGRRSLIGFAENIGYIEVEWLSETADPFFNINSPEDLRNAELVLEKMTIAD